MTAPERLATALEGRYRIERELGRLAALAGERETAVEAYHRYLTLRRDPEPAMMSQRDSVRAELAAIDGR